MRTIFILLALVMVSGCAAPPTASTINVTTTFPLQFQATQSTFNKPLAEALADVPATWKLNASEESHTPFYGHVSNIIAHLTTDRGGVDISMDKWNSVDNATAEINRIYKRLAKDVEFLNVGGSQCYSYELEKQYIQCVKGNIVFSVTSDSGEDAYSEIIAVAKFIDSRLVTVD